MTRQIVKIDYSQVQSLLNTTNCNHNCAIEDLIFSPQKTANELCLVAGECVSRKSVHSWHSEFLICLILSVLRRAW